MGVTIQVKGISVAYGHKRVLSNIYLNIESSYIHGLIGPNGAGKSTLFKCILNQVSPTSGSILIHGKPSVDKIQSIAYVPQKDAIDMQFPATVLDVVLMGRFPHKKWYQFISQQDRNLALHAIELMGMSAYMDRQIGELSGGQQQRVFIARALCQDADIFLLDEPFVGVDAKTEKIIIDILKKLRNDGKTILVVHHDLDSVQHYFDRVILINQRLISYGDTSKVFTAENISKTFASQSHLIQQHFQK